MSPPSFRPVVLVQDMTRDFALCNKPLPLNKGYISSYSEKEMKIDFLKNISLVTVSQLVAA